MKSLAYIFAVFVAVVLFELMSQALFFVRQGQLLPTYDRKVELQAQNRLDTMEKRVGLPGLRLHPFLGWVNTGSTGGFNNAGFRDQIEFPYVAQPDEFLVGVFGGSVAANFWSYNAAFRTFQIELQRLRPELAGKRIVLLNFAKEAYRQPQQLATLNYFAINGQKLDLVLNIDGYNEITSAWFNRKSATDIAYPSINLMMEFAQLTTADGVGTAAATRLLSKSLHERAYEQDFASIWLVMLGTSKLLPFLTVDTSEENAGGFQYDQKANLLFIPRTQTTGSNEEIVEGFAQYMKQSSALMASAAQAMGSSYLEVLQPNQYVETNRTFSEEEAKIAILQPTPYEGVVDKAYRRLRARMSDDTGVTYFVDASFALDELPVQAYADNCCHMTEDGRKTLSMFIAGKAADQLDETSSVAR